MSNFFVKKYFFTNQAKRKGKENNRKSEKRGKKEKKKGKERRREKKKGKEERKRKKEGNERKPEWLLFSIAPQARRSGAATTKKETQELVPESP